jgi:hypothetical protein
MELAFIDKKVTQKGEKFGSSKLSLRYWTFKSRRSGRLLKESKVQYKDLD